MAAKLRTNLDQALSALGLPVSSYTDPSLSGVTIYRVHIEELRDVLSENGPRQETHP